jgi:DNA-binding MarR family transcriptional regulator
LISPPSSSVDAEDLETARRLGAAISRLMRAATRARAQDAANGGVFHSMALLVTLMESGPLRSASLADAVLSDPSTISRQVAALVDQGLVVREPDPEDRRATLLAISDAGREAVAQKMRLRDLHLAHMTADWSARDRARLADLLDRFSTCFATSVTDHSLSRLHDATRSENS